jgi:hypothetical protein
MTADKIFEKMGKSKAARKELMHQMKKYRTRENPFDIDLGETEFPTTWWFSMEDNFPKGKDYLVQLALKLLSVTPHAAGCERVWSSLGWLYGKRRNRLGLNKIENMYKLSAYYHAHAKQELPYYSLGKSSEEVRNIIVDAHLNPDDDLIESMDDVEHINYTEEVFGEEDGLLLSNILNLDANVFIESLDEIIEDSENNMEEEYVDIQNVNEPEYESDIDWDPAVAADEIIDTM